MPHWHYGKLTRSVVLRASIVIGKMNMAHLAAFRSQAPHGPSRHCSFLLRTCLHPSRAKAILQSWAFSFLFPDTHQLGGQLPFGVCSWWCLFRTCVPAALLMKFTSHLGGTGEPDPSHRSTPVSSVIHRPAIFTNNVEGGILYKINFHFSIRLKIR